MKGPVGGEISITEVMESSESHDKYATVRKTFGPRDWLGHVLNSCLVILKLDGELNLLLC